MTLNTPAWKCLFIKPGDQSLCTAPIHVIGASPHSQLLEVAVPAHTPIVKPYLYLPYVPPVSIELLLNVQRIEQVGFIMAYEEGLQSFLENAKEGIYHHGTSLGDYYRSRYPGLRPRIEYIILLHDLPSASISQYTPPEYEAVRNTFSQAALYLAFGSIDPDDKVSNKLREMDSRQVMATIRESLERNCRDLHRLAHRDLAIVSHVRHVLVRARGPVDRAQLHLFRAQINIVDISSAFAALLGGGEDARQSSHFADLMQQVSSARVFDRVLVNKQYIRGLAKWLSMDQWLVTTLLPRLWISHLTSQQMMSFSVLVEAASTLCETAKNPDNTEKLFIIWSFKHGLVNDQCCEDISPATGRLFKVTIRSLLEPTSSAQLVIDMTTLVCIMRLSPAARPHSPSSDTLGQLDAIFRKECQEGASVVLDRCLMSLHRVLVAQDAPGRNAALASFVNEIGLPKLMLGINDGHVDFYWHFRLSGRVSHYSAMSSTQQRVGFFPLKLPPLNLEHEDQEPQDHNTKEESEASDSCIIVSANALGSRMGFQKKDMDRAVLSESETAEDNPSARQCNKSDSPRRTSPLSKTKARSHSRSARGQVQRIKGSRRLRERYQRSQLARR